MAPSFDQLDPEQSEYDGEEEVDFSGMCAAESHALGGTNDMFRSSGAV
jgi:hypothetical protein